MPDNLDPDLKCLIFKNFLVQFLNRKKQAANILDPQIQWRSEYLPFEPETFEYPTFQSSKFKWFGIQMVGLALLSTSTKKTRWQPFIFNGTIAYIKWSRLATVS